MEQNTLFIVLKPNGDAKCDEIEGGALRDRVEELGTSIEMMPCVWQVKSDRRGIEAFEALRGAIGTGDQLLVVDSTNDEFSSWPDRGGVLEAGS